jgi:enamine deaminase RidA (YjgF/YER057c/UK114 family)
MSSSVEAKLESMGITVPVPGPPKGNYVTAVKVGEDMLHLSGHLPLDCSDKDKNEAGGKLICGKLGGGLSIQEGYISAQCCAIQILGTLKKELGSLDKVKRIVKIVGFVNCTDDFQQQPAVINGASDFFVNIFGREVGSHARSAVGTNALPLGAATEVECIVQISTD